MRSRSRPLWVAVVYWHKTWLDGHVAVLRPRDSLVPVYDRGSAGVVAMATLESGRKSNLVPESGGVIAAFFFDRPPAYGALAMRTGGQAGCPLSGLVGLIQIQVSAAGESHETTMEDHGR